MKKVSSVLLIALSCLLIMGCTKNDSIKVGITQISEHPSLDSATEGFKQAFTDAKMDVTFDEKIAQGDQNNSMLIASNFVADKVDLIFANSTPSALTAYNATKDIPILFTAVSDAVGPNLVNEDGYGTNISGTIDLHPDAIGKTIDFINTYFPNSTIGLIYNAGEPNSTMQIDLVKEAVKGTNLSTVEATVATSGDVKAAGDSLVGRVDVFYIVTDNTVVSGLAPLVDISETKKIPLFVGELDSVSVGGFAAFGFSYYDIGYQTGEMAISILKGEKKVNEIQVQYPNELKLVINKEASEKMGITWNSDWDTLGEVLK